MSIRGDSNLQKSVEVWKFFVKAHPDADMEAVVEHIVEQTQTEILTYLKAEIEKSLLTDEEIQHERIKVENRFFMPSDYDVAEWDKVVAQAQVNNIIELLEEK